MGNIMSLQNETDTNFWADPNSLFGKRLQKALLTNDIKKRACCMNTVGSESDYAGIQIPIANITIKDKDDSEMFKERDGVLNKWTSVDANDKRILSKNGMVVKRLNLKHITGEDKNKFCNLDNKQFTAPLSASDENVTQHCDAFYTNYCAKIADDMKCYKRKEGKLVLDREKPECSTKDNDEKTFPYLAEYDQISQYPEDCSCINSMYGETYNDKTESRNLFNIPSGEQAPLVADTACSTRAFGAYGDAKKGSAYVTLGHRSKKSVVICTNELNLDGVDAENVILDNINLENNCGPATSQDEKQLDKAEQQKQDEQEKREDVGEVVSEEGMDSIYAKVGGKQNAIYIGIGILIFIILIIILRR